MGKIETQIIIRYLIISGVFSRIKICHCANVP